MKDGVYLMRFEHDGRWYERRVVLKEGFYHFSDERGLPLPGSSWLSVEVSVKSGSEFKLVDSVASEMVTWNRVEEVQPDDGITVMLNVPDNESATVWPGYLEAEEWFWADGLKVEQDVVAWAEIPIGFPWLATVDES